MKKILCVLQLPPPVHGASLMNSYLTRSKLINYNFNLEIINLQFSKSIQHLEKFSFFKVYKAIRYSLLIIKKVIKSKPDLIYFTLSPKGFAFYRDAFYVLIFKIFNCKIIFHLHGKGIKENIRGNILKKHIYIWVFKNTNVICLSKILTTDIDTIFQTAPFIVPNGIPNKSEFKSGKKQVNKIPQILFLSNYIKTKGILVLIEALTILKEKGHVFLGRFVGGAADLTPEMLERMINTKNLKPFVEIVGPRYGEDKTKEFQNADIFVFPTFYRNETFGLVNLEAMQFGLPVISTFEGGIPDIIINNETGFLVDKENPVMLADRIEILLEDSDLRISMGEKGYNRYINNYTVEHFESNMLKIFKDILKENQI